MGERVLNLRYRNSRAMLATAGSRGRGGVAERLNAAVLKTAGPQGLVGSNPTPSAPVPGTPSLASRAEHGLDRGSVISGR